MAEKEIKIKISTEADISSVEDLKTLIEEIQQSAKIEVNVDDSEITDTANSTKELSENIEDATGSVDDLNTSVGNVDGSAISETSESADELGSSADDAASSIDSLSDSAAGVDGSSMSEAAASADELGDSAGNADNEVQNLSNDLGLIEGAALLDVAGNLNNLGSNAEGMAQDMNTAAISVGQLATQTGIAEPQMVNLVNTISNATFPQSEAMQYITVLDQLNVSADNLGSSATNMDRINDAFGIGSDKVVSLTGNLYAMGVPADQLDSSFNALAYAQSNVAGGVDQFSNVLNRLGPSFSEYNLNVDQAAVITAAASQKWGTGRKAMSNLSSALKDANGDTKALEEALGLQPGALDNASSATGEYEGTLQDLANEEAEHKTFLDELGAAWEDVSLSMSPVLEPMGSFMGLIGQAGSYAVGINGIVTLAQSMRTLELASIAEGIATKASAAAQWLLNIAMDANPIMIVVLAIIALVAILGYLYFNNEQVRQAVDALGAAFMNGFQIIMDTVMNVVGMIIPTLQGLWEYIMTLGGLIPANASITGNQIIDTVIKVIAFIATLPMQLGVVFANAIAKALGFGSNFAQRMLSAGSKSVSNFIGYISSLPGKLSTELSNMYSTVSSWAATLPQKFWDAGVQAVQNFLNALGIHSPGTMQTKLIWEISEMGRKVPIESTNLLRNVKNLGADIVDEFGDPELGVDISNISPANLSVNENNVPSSTINFNLEIGSVDSEDRVNQIVEAVRRELSWNNATAGRTI